MKNILLLIIYIINFSYISYTQRIIYGEVNKDNNRQTNFEIIGRYGSNVLIFKNFRDNNVISVFDNNMKEINKVNIDYFPPRVLNVDFISYPDYAWMIYQYQEKDLVYCTAAKIDGNGNKIGNPISLDTTEINYNSNKLYSIIYSEDKQRIMIFKINNKEQSKYLFKTLLFDKDLNNLKTSSLILPLSNKNDILTDFTLDNQGTLVFGRGDRTGSNQNIIRFSLAQKSAMSDSFVMHQIKLDNISLDEVKIKADNTNNRYVLVSFYYKTRKNVIEGIFYSEWDKSSDKENINTIIPLGDDIRKDAKGENNMKNAFNEYYLQQITLKKDGGFVVTSENLYMSNGRNTSSYNRWDYFSLPYLVNREYYSYYGLNYWNSAGAWANSGMRWNNTLTRYNADNILILSFDKTGKLQWSNVIHKSQFDDESEGAISYQVANTGDAIRFIYNDFEKRVPLLVVQNIAADGQITNSPTLKNLDKGFMFFPRYAKQVGQKQVIIPCLYRKNLAFAKIDFE